jgi:parallel beta-helix repeat protein
VFCDGTPVSRATITGIISICDEVPPRIKLFCQHCRAVTLLVAATEIFSKIIFTKQKEFAMKLIIKSSILIGSLLLSASAFADEGKIEITGSMTIMTPGSYILLNDVVGTHTAISINSSNVKLDLNGFTVSSINSRGITISSGNKNIEVTNGAVTAPAGHGIYVPGKSETPRNIKFSNLRISDNAFYGISLEFNSGFIIEDCLISGNILGIYAFKPGLVANNVISNNDVGIRASNIVEDKLGYRANVLFGNATNIDGGVNLGNNLCSGVICP